MWAKDVAFQEGAAPVPVLRPTSGWAKEDAFLSSGTLASWVGVFWFCGLILFGKDFTLIGIHPIYINEVVLAILALGHFRQALPSALVCFVTFVAFVICGALEHGSLIFAAKDMLWLECVMFICVFPRRMSLLQLKTVGMAVALRLAALILMSIGLLESRINPYSDGVMVVCVTAAISLVSGKKTLFWALPFLLLASMGSTFKTATIAVFAIPILFKFRSFSLLAVSPWSIAFSLVVVIVVITKGWALDVMIAAVDWMNVLLGAFGLSMEPGHGTSFWRAVVWDRLMKIWFSRGQFLFGELPGHNFMNPKLLQVSGWGGITGGEGMGINRSPHNFLVLVLLRSGLVGLALYFGALYSSGVLRHLKELAPLLAVALILGFTGTVMETPYAAPIIYVTFSLLIGYLDLLREWGRPYS